MTTGRAAHLPLGSGREFDRIRAIWHRLGERAAPSGDDCAIVKLGSEQIALSLDVTIEGTHFQAGWLSATELGWRACAAALSDLAAVAARPQGVMVSLGVPAELSESDTADLMEGVADAAASVGAVVWGGDLVKSDRLVVDVLVAGIVREPVRRRGAEVGDRLWVTGALGGPAAALKAWELGKAPDQDACSRFARPTPRIAEAMWLRRHGAKAMIDISDGLIGDAGHLAAASKIQCVIEQERVPVHSGVSDAADALMSGEEFELLVALPRDFDELAAAEFIDQFELPLTRVGFADLGVGVRVLKLGKPVSPPVGFTHFG
jgi:thiamine-monophosphate kinase